MTQIFSGRNLHKYKTVVEVSGLRVRKYRRDKYDCVHVSDITGRYTWPPRPVLIRVEDGKFLWGEFDCTTEKVEIEVDGKIYSRTQTKETKWYPIELPEVFKDIMELVGVYIE